MIFSAAVQSMLSGGASHLGGSISGVDGGGGRGGGENKENPSDGLKSLLIIDECSKQLPEIDGEVCKDKRGEEELISHCSDDLDSDGGIYDSDNTDDVDVDDVDDDDVDNVDVDDDDDEEEGEGEGEEEENKKYRRRLPTRDDPQARQLEKEV